MSDFVKCHELAVNKNEVSSMEWDNSANWRGGNSYLIIHMKNGINHRIAHTPDDFGGVDCYALEKEILK